MFQPTPVVLPPNAVPNPQAIRYGVAWYPEHWDESRWPADLRLMRDAGMNVVRVAEFAWSRLEPADGQFQLDWLRRAIDLAASFGLDVVIGTPSATPPAWLTSDHPDTLGVDHNGNRRSHGGRCHYSVNSPTYRTFVRRINRELATAFGNHPSVIGWQIDNEYSSDTFDPHTAVLWRQWLQSRYGSLDSLNRQWSMSYWSQDYSDWNQISTPTGWHHNPCITSEYKRFMSDCYRAYQRDQIDTLRAAIHPRQWITHNFHAFDNLDYPLLASDLDRASWDIYVGSGPLDPAVTGVANALCRGMSAQPHWIMETQAGHVLFGAVPSHLDPGENRRLVWHHIGNGAAAVLFWQWRAAPGCHEQFWGTLLANDGTPRPIYHELAATGHELRKLQGLLQTQGPRTPGHVALLHSYPDRWSLLWQRHHHQFDPREQLTTTFRALRSKGLTVDIVTPESDLSKYPLVVANSLYLLSEPTAEHLCNYVRAGGHLLLGPRTGTKSQFNALQSRRNPGIHLADLLGAETREFYPLSKPVQLTSPTLPTLTATLWAESLQLLTGADPATHTLASFDGQHPWLQRLPAIITRPIGTGRITYCGCWLDQDSTSKLIDWACQQADLTPPSHYASDSPAVEICLPPGSDGITILINHGPDATVRRDSPSPAYDLLTGLPLDREFSLPANAVLVARSGSPLH